MSKWKCEICGSNFDNFYAQGFNNKIYCPLCFFKEENQQLKEQFIATSKGLKKVIVKRKKWKRKYLKGKNKNKQLLKQLHQKDSIIEEAINHIKDTCIEQIPDMSKGCYRETASIGDLKELLDILNKYKGDNNE